MTDDGHSKKSEVPEIYANGLQLGISPFDVTILFGLQEPESVDTKQVVATGVPTVFAPLTRVRLSLQTAAILAGVLACD